MPITASSHSLRGGEPREPLNRVVGPWANPAILLLMLGDSAFFIRARDVAIVASSFARSEIIWEAGISRGLRQRILSKLP